MFKRALRAFVLLPLLIAGPSPANAAGTIAYSLSQQLDQYGNPLTGCLLYTIQAGTTSTPQNAYQDTALTQAQSNPMVCDAAGRLPQFFLADGLIKVRLTDKFGTPQVVVDNILVIGASSGGGGGGSIDPTTIAATGDLKWSYGVSALSGWVRANGRTIGSATSGATERANADTQALFQYLWSTNSGLAVSGGRGASSIADWTANKTIALPDTRGRVLAGLDDMGNSSAARLNTILASTTLGNAAGEQQHTLTGAEMPAHTHVTSGNTGSENANHTHTISPADWQIVNGILLSGGGGDNVVVRNSARTPFSVTMSVESAPHVHDISSTTSSTGSSGAHNVVQPTMVTTIYLKL